MDIDVTDYLRFLLALLFVLGLIGGLALLAKRFGLGNRGPARRGGTKRLAIVETMVLDAKRRVVLVRRDDTEHLLLIGGTTDQVIEAGIEAETHEARDAIVQALPVRAEAPR